MIFCKLRNFFFLFFFLILKVYICKPNTDNFENFVFSQNGYIKYPINIELGYQAGFSSSIKQLLRSDEKNDQGIFDYNRAFKKNLFSQSIIIGISWTQISKFFAENLSSYPKLGFILKWNRLQNKGNIFSFLLNFSPKRDFLSFFSFYPSLIIGPTFCKIPSVYPKNIKVLDKEEALNYFSLDKNKKVLLVFSGSLGAKSINDSILKDLKNILDLGLQLIWITGNIYFDDIINKIEKDFLKKIIIMPYCSEMQIPYSCADIAIARSGAVTTAEICRYNIPTIFIPSINVTDNQQKKNIEHLILSKACLYVEENVIKYHLFKQLKWLLENDIKIKAIKSNLKKFYIEDSEKKILEQIRIFCK